MSVLIGDPNGRRGRVVNSSASYSGGFGLKSLPGDRLSLLRFFVVFLRPFTRILV
jgi:hypothetical protein